MTDAWADFLHTMVARGLRAPLLVVSDGAPGLIAATELVFTGLNGRRSSDHGSSAWLR